MEYTASPYLVRVFDYGILHLELNTLLYILVLVLVVMFFLNRWLFRPILRTLDRREQAMQNLQGEAREHRETIAGLTASYQENLSQVLEEVARVRAETHKESQQAVGAILERARQGAQQQFEAAMRELEAQVEQARGELRASAKTLAEQATDRILGA